MKIIFHFNCTYIQMLLTQRRPFVTSRTLKRMTAIPYIVPLNSRNPGAICPRVPTGRQITLTKYSLRRPFLPSPARRSVKLRLRSNLELRIKISMLAILLKELRLYLVFYFYFW